jgi:hypothetical protein
MEATVDLSAFVDRAEVCLRGSATAQPKLPDDCEERQRPDTPPPEKVAKLRPRHVLLGQKATDEEIEKALEWLDADRS